MDDAVDVVVVVVVVTVVVVDVGAIFLHLNVLIMKFNRNNNISQQANLNEQIINHVYHYMNMFFKFINGHNVSDRGC